jgi:hypothetical protein
MKAKFNSTAKTKYTTSHRKEGKCFFEEFSVLVRNGDPDYTRIPACRLSKAVELRLYGTGNTNTACLWIRGGDNFYTQGSGRAGGYGYHRPSAAAGEAIRNAGFELLTNEGKPCDIGGVGESAIEEALCAIADALGLTDYALVRSHP